MTEPIHSDLAPEAAGLLVSASTAFALIGPVTNEFGRFVPLLPALVLVVGVLGVASVPGVVVAGVIRRCSRR